MPALASDLRKTLENTVVKARDKAEGGARDALTALAVDASEPFASMSEEERKLRNRLRARGRQLGDQRDPQKGSQSIERLVREMAYEHWHRMLFARFLAENQLLIEPSSGVAISLDECEELATEEGTDLWGLAAQYAQSMLPQIFRTDDPVLAAKLPLEIRQQLQGLVEGLAEDVFAASDSLGWVYQFWQTLEKDRVNQSETKIGADELPAVTQLFTEPYMVDFLLHNSLGAWWVSRHPDKPCPVELSYLRTLEDGTPAAGKFEGWPGTLKDFTLLDPCCGSGHFLVAAFLMLVPMRMESEGLDSKDAVDAVLAENLYGLEIDPRCVEIAVFALALAAWRFPCIEGKPLGARKHMPALNIACCGLRVSTSLGQWQAIAPGTSPTAERIRLGLAQMHQGFSQAPVLGSLVSPEKMVEKSLLVAGFEELRDVVEKALSAERNSSTDSSSGEAMQEAGLAAKGLLDAARILGRRFNLVATNVPYLGVSYQCKELSEFTQANFPNAKHDLALAFIERCGSLANRENGFAALVTMGEWTHLGSYARFREGFIGKFSLPLIARLGWNAFTSTVRANPALFVYGRSPQESVRFIDCTAAKTPDSNRDQLATNAVNSFTRNELKGNPDSRIIVPDQLKGALLGDFADAKQGMHAGDLNQFFGLFWEVPRTGGTWELTQSAINQTRLYGGRDKILLWENETGQLAALANSVKHLNHAAQNWKQGKQFWGKHGVAVGLMGNIGCALYSGNPFDVNSAVIVPKKSVHLPAIWAFCESGEFSESVRRLSNSLRIAPRTLLKVRFDFEKWQDVASKQYADGLPKPYSDNPAQWIFHGHPKSSFAPLQVAVCRLVGYTWPAEQDPSIELSENAQELVDSCAELDEFVDNDGIVCLPPVRAEQPAYDRLRRLLAKAFGDQWSSSKERELLLEAAASSNSRKPDESLELWLRNSFFGEHCKLFQGRPFVWQVWDGHPKGFSALVNAHKLAAPNGQGRRILELLAYTYLGDWIDSQKLDQSEGVDGADDRLASALDLQSQLRKILDGEPPCDIFVRWKALHKQSIGWDPDINDGIQLNIRPFLASELRKGGKKGAGILRVKPGSIDWKKDRGKDVFGSKEEFPWFWGWDESSPAMATDFGAPVPGAPPAGDSFDGNRWNDLHYTRAAKEAARSRHRSEG